MDSDGIMNWALPLSSVCADALSRVSGLSVDEITLPSTTCSPLANCSIELPVTRMDS